MSGSTNELKLQLPRQGAAEGWGLGVADGCFLCLTAPSLTSQQKGAGQSPEDSSGGCVPAEAQPV